MISVDVFYRVTISGGDDKITLEMDQERYTKFRSEAANMPEFAPVFTGLTISRDIGSTLPEVENYERECPDFIEPPEEEASRWLPKEVTEVPDPKPIRVKTEDRDYSIYIRMLEEETPSGKIIDQMASDFEISRSSAQSYFYRYVKPYLPEAPALVTPERALEIEKKETEKELEAKIQRKPKVFVDKPVDQEISDLPDFPSFEDFITYTIVNEIAREYSGRKLKEIYLRTHPHINW